MRSRRLALGELLFTSGVRSTIHLSDVFDAIDRHAECDWGDVDDCDWFSNEEALVQGARILSVYRDRNGARFWIITEADRSATTVLLPEEY